MKHLIQFGTGNIGKELIRQILFYNHKNTNHGDTRGKGLNSFQMSYIGLCNSMGCVFDPGGIDEVKISGKDFNNILVRPRKDILKAIKSIKNCIIVDATASDEMSGLLLDFVDDYLKDNYIVLANKKPLCGPYEFYKKFVGTGRVFYEATVGAGLPIIKTINSMIVTGDEIFEISGCFSGTLGFILSKTEEGVLFSDAVKLAQELGYTEPNPDDDLCGRDVARKALILARLIGYEIELSDVDVESLVGMSDEGFKLRFEWAKKNGNVVRYVAKIGSGKCRVSLDDVKKESQIGRLKGPDNIVVIQSNRYNERSLCVSGPGAGPAVTAAGVLDNIIECARLIL